MEDAKKLVVGKTKIGTIESKVEGEVFKFDILYGNVASPMVNKKMLRLPKETYYKMVQEFLDSDEGLEYSVPTEYEMQQAINQITDLEHKIHSEKSESVKQPESTEKEDTENEIVQQTDTVSNAKHKKKKRKKKHNKEISEPVEVVKPEVTVVKPEVVPSFVENTTPEPEPKEDDPWYFENDEEAKQESSLDNTAENAEIGSESNETDEFISDTKESSSNLSNDQDAYADEPELEHEEAQSDKTIVVDFEDNYQNGGLPVSYDPVNSQNSVALNNNNAKQLVEIIARLADIEQQSQVRMEEIEALLKTTKGKKTPAIVYVLIAVLFFACGVAVTYFVK